MSENVITERRKYSLGHIKAADVSEGSMLTLLILIAGIVILTRKLRAGKQEI